MGRKDRDSKGKSKRFSWFKFIFFLVFLVLSILFTLFTISFIGVYNDGWEWAKSIPGISALDNWFMNMINNLTETSPAKVPVKKAGIYVFLIGIDVFLVYTTLFYPIKKIPVIGKMLRWLTGIIPSLAIIAIIIGAIFLWVV